MLIEISEEHYAEMLIEILKRYEYSSIEAPRIRRFLVQQVTWIAGTCRGYHVGP
jgi:hypothetical protein